MIYAQPGAAFIAEPDATTTGLVGTIGVRILNRPSGSVVLARTTSGITEVPSGSGLYVVTLTAPSTPGTYWVDWDNGAGNFAREDLVVTATASQGASGAEIASGSRVVQGLVSGMSVQFTDADGNAHDPSPATCTVTVTRDDGTALYTGATASHDGTGLFSLALTSADTAKLDILTATWTSSLGVVMTTVEVVGGFYFSVAEAKADQAMSGKTSAELQDARTQAEQLLERACRVAFVPRYARESVTADSSMWLGVTNRKVRAVRSVSINGTALDTSGLAQVIVDDRLLVRSLGWQGALGGVSGAFPLVPESRVVVGYEHGLDRPSQRMKKAALLLAKHIVVKGPIDERALSIPTEDGNIPLLTPGVRGSFTGIPEVDAAIIAEGYMDAGA